MKFFLSVLVLLSTMISTGLSLTCISCNSKSQAPCTGSTITCASTEDVCTYILTETKIKAYGLTTYTVVRGCGQSSECDNRKSLSNQYMMEEINTACCKTDKCAPVEPTVSSGNASENGLICPSCYSLTSSTCVPDTKIQCTGNETRCTTYSISTTTKPSKPVMSMAGCATENMCSNYTGTATSSTIGEINITVECSNATVSPSTARPSSRPESPGTRCLAIITSGIRGTIHTQTKRHLSSNSSAVYYTTRVTFKPTNGAAKLRFGLALIMTFTLLVVKNFL